MYIYAYNVVVVILILNDRTSTRRARRSSAYLVR